MHVSIDIVGKGAKLREGLQEGINVASVHFGEKAKGMGFVRATDFSPVWIEQWKERPENLGYSSMGLTIEFTVLFRRHKVYFGVHLQLPFKMNLIREPDLRSYRMIDIFDSLSDSVFCSVIYDRDTLNQSIRRFTQLPADPQSYRSRSRQSQEGSRYSSRSRSNLEPRLEPRTGRRPHDRPSHPSEHRNTPSTSRTSRGSHDRPSITPLDHADRSGSHPRRRTRSPPSSHSIEYTRQSRSRTSQGTSNRPSNASQSNGDRSRSRSDPRTHSHVGSSSFVGLHPPRGRPRKRNSELPHPYDQNNSQLYHEPYDGLDLGTKKSVSRRRRDRKCVIC